MVRVFRWPSVPPGEGINPTGNQRFAKQILPTNSRRLPELRVIWIVGSSSKNDPVGVTGGASVFGWSPLWHGQCSAKQQISMRS